MSVRTPQIPDLKNAIEIYYSNVEIFPKDVRKIFDISAATACRLCKVARDYMQKNDVVQWNSRAVNTKAAFKSWGLEIDDLEKRLVKLNKLQSM